MSSNPDVPPFIGYVETTVNALRLIHAARQGVIPRITRRLNDNERRTMIKSGAVFVFSVEESGIKRWTGKPISRFFLAAMSNPNPRWSSVVAISNRRKLPGRLCLYVLTTSLYLTNVVVCRCTGRSMSGQAVGATRRCTQLTIPARDWRTEAHQSTSDTRQEAPTKERSSLEV